MIGTEFLTSNINIAYPLADDQRIPDDFMSLLVDGKILIPAILDTPSVLLTKLTYNFNSLHDSNGINLEISIFNNKHIPLKQFNVTILVSKLNSNSYYTVITSTDTDSDIRIMLVVDNDTVHKLYDSNYGTTKEVPLELRFADSVIEISPKSVNTLSIQNYTDQFDRTKKDKLIENIRGDVVLKPGYNIELTETYSMLISAVNTKFMTSNIAIPNILKNDDGHNITISAIVGAGLGVAPCEEEQEVNELDNMFKSSRGNIRISNDSCYDLVPMNSEGKLKIVNKCVACCQCINYIDEVNRLHNISDILNSINFNLTSIMADTYNSAAKDFNLDIGEFNIDPERKYNFTFSGTRASSSSNMTGSSIVGTLVRARFTCRLSNPTTEPIRVSLQKIDCTMNLSSNDKTTIYPCNQVGKTVAVTTSETEVQHRDYDFTTSESNYLSSYELENRIVNPGKSISFTAEFAPPKLVQHGSQLDPYCFHGDVWIVIKEESGKELLLTKTAIINQIV